MKLMIDSDVVLDFILERKEWLEYSKQIVMLSVGSDIETRSSTLSLANIYYVARKKLGDRNTRLILEELITYLPPMTVTPLDITQALTSPVKDFEDGIQAECAFRHNIDYIVTRNCKDFENSPVKALTPEEFMKNYEVV